MIRCSQLDQTISSRNNDRTRECTTCLVEVLNIFQRANFVFIFTFQSSSTVRFIIVFYVVGTRFQILSFSDLRSNKLSVFFLLDIVDQFDNLCGIWQDGMFSNKLPLGYQRMTTLLKEYRFELRQWLVMIIGALKCLDRLHGCEFVQKEFSIDDIFAKRTSSVCYVTILTYQ